MKITVNSVAPKITKNNKTYQDVTYNGSEKASLWEGDLVPFIGKEVDVELTINGNFKNIKLGAPVVAPVAPTVGTNVSAPITHPSTLLSTPKIGSDFETRKVSLMIGSDNAFKMGKTVTPDVLKENIQFCEDYLRNGFEKS